MKLTMIALLMIPLSFGCGDDKHDDSGTDTLEPARDTDGETDGGTEDSGTDDAGTEDSGTEDAGTEDSGTDDSGTDDRGTEDSGTEDSGTEDSGTEDSGTDDSGTEDSGTEDSGTDDSGTDDSGATDVGTEDGGSEDGGGTSGSSDAAYAECTMDADCADDMFCGIECWTGGCGPDGSVPEGTLGSFCQPCIECEFDTDAVSGSCETCGGSLYDDPSPDCSAADLSFRAEVRLPDGTVPPSFSTSDSLVAAGIVENLCDRDLPYVTSTTCLVDSATITSGTAGGATWMEALFCGEAVTEHTVPAADLAESSFSVGVLPAGEHNLTIRFGASEVASIDFTVVGG